MKKCKICNNLTNNFRSVKGKNGIMYLRNTCKPCESHISKKWNNDNIERYKKNTEAFLDKNKDYKRKWKIKNKEHVISYTRKYEQKISIKLRKRLSRAINRAIMNKSFSSILNILPYSIDELKNHLENQFEPWMNWNNWGVYIAKKWDNNNSNTWKWHIDHIIPQSYFKCKSYKDINFKKCWELNNLRPLSAKENILKSSKLIGNNK